MRDELVQLWTSRIFPRHDRRLRLVLGLLYIGYGGGLNIACDMEFGCSCGQNIIRRDILYHKRARALVGGLREIMCYELSVLIERYLHAHILSDAKKVFVC